MSLSKRYIIAEPLLLALMVAIGMLVGNKLSPDNNKSIVLGLESEKEVAKIGRVEEIIRFIDAKYVEEIDNDLLITNAVNSIFSELDPHSNYINPNHLQDIQQEMGSAYDGIGILTLFRDDTVFVQQVIEDSPAAVAGMRMGDRILAINQMKMSGTGKSYEELRPALSFDLGEEKELLIKRMSQNQNIPIKASEITNTAVEIAYAIDSNRVYIKLKRFSENTYKDFMAAIESLVDINESFDLILDLRDNPGGYLPETVKILNQIFKEKDRLLVYTQDRNKKKTEYKTTGNRFFKIDKVAILINHNSASASEIIAAAVQDWDRGIVIGETSFGKGLVQEQYSLSNGGAIRLTVSKYYTPVGRIIQKPFENDMVAIDTDSTSFYTKILKRKVSGSGGIVPDFLVDQGEKTQSDACSIAIYDVLYYLSKNHPSDFIEIEFDDFFSSYKLYLQENYGIEEESLCKKDVETELKSIQIQAKSGKTAMYKYLLQSDESIDKALNQFNRVDLFSLSE